MKNNMQRSSTDQSQSYTTIRDLVLKCNSFQGTFCIVRFGMKNTVSGEESKSTATAAAAVAAAAALHPAANRIW